MFIAIIALIVYFSTRIGKIRNLERRIQSLEKKERDITKVKDSEQL